MYYGQFGAAQKKDYYAEHKAAALFNSPAKIAAWTAVTLLGVAVIGAQFVKVAKK